MSSFKRRDPSKQSGLKSYPGTRVSPASTSTVNTSSGISSLDDILGGGLPLSCSLVVAAPDPHSSYGQLVQQYYVAEGLACGHHVCVIDSEADDFMKDLLWYPKSALQDKGLSGQVPSGGDGDPEDEDQVQTDMKVKIAWRYEQMKQFQTTVSAPISNSENYCHVFDLTSRIPQSVLDEAVGSSKISLIPPNSPAESSEDIPTVSALRHIEKTLQKQNVLPVRVCIPSLGSPSGWGDITAQSVLHFLHSLRALLRKYPHGCASITLSPRLSSDNWGGDGWLKKVGWLTDASLTLTAFSANPSLSAMFPSHHGFVHIHSLPSPSTLVAPSDRFSTLRGLASSANSFGGSGENNLAFKCTRKRLIFETLHLDLEGGVSERRTSAPSSTAVELTTGNIGAPIEKKTVDHVVPRGGARIDIEIEGVEQAKKEEAVSETSSDVVKPQKPKKKKVAFFSDRPDVYDF